MNILFVNTFDVSPFLGGTERITDTLCREFRKRCLCRCYLAYYEGIDSLYKKTVFDGRLCLGSRKNVALLIDYIVKKDIDVVLLQGAVRISKRHKAGNRKEDKDNICASPLSWRRAGRCFVE